MALVVATLQTALTRLFTNPPKDAVTVASDMAKAYANYAATANAGAALPVFLQTEELGARAQFVALTGAPQTGSPATYAAVWQAGIDAFWLTSPAPVQFAGAGAGPILPSPGGQAALLSGVTAAVTGFKDPASAAAAVASAIDVYTRTFPVVLTPPGPPPVLIT